MPVSWEAIEGMLVGQEVKVNCNAGSDRMTGKPEVIEHAWLVAKPERFAPVRTWEVIRLTRTYEGIRD